MIATDSHPLGVGACQVLKYTLTKPKGYISTMKIVVENLISQIINIKTNFESLGVL